MDTHHQYSLELDDLMTEFFVNYSLYKYTNHPHYRTEYHNILKDINNLYESFDPDPQFLYKNIFLTELDRL